MSRANRRKSKKGRPGGKARAGGGAHLDTVLQAAVDHFQAGRLPAADAQCRRILGHAPEHPVALHLLGVIARCQNDHAGAVSLLRKAIAAAPDNANAYSDLGGAFYDLGQFTEAAAMHGKATALMPGNFVPLMNTGNAEHAAGRPKQALACYHKALTIEPRLAGAYVNIAAVHHDEGERTSAYENYRRALELDANLAQAHTGLARLLAEDGDDGEAREHLRAALAIDGGDATALAALGSVLLEARDWDEAVQVFRALTKSAPETAGAWGNLGIALNHMGEWDAALEALHRAVEQDPNDGITWFMLGTTYHSVDRLDDSLACFDKAIDADPGLAKAHNNRGYILLKTDQLAEAAAAFETALEISPDYADALNNLGNVRRELGELEEAERLYRAALEHDPQFTEAHGNILLTIHARPDATPDQVLSAHRGWADQHAAPLQKDWPAHGNDKDPERPLKVGLVSADLGAHPVGYFTIGFVENHAADDLEITCYSSRTPDSWTERFMRAAEHWVDAQHTSDQELAARIAADEIDVLFDLSGHTTNNRMMVFARKPAPVQIGWAGYPSTTGMEAMDFMVTDSISTLQGEDAHSVETPIRMPNAFVSYTPPDDAPDVAPSPCVERGHVTFGCFSNPAKINTPLLERWSAIMRQVPDSRLRLAYKHLDADANRRRITEVLAANAIAADRVDIEGMKTPDEIMKLYGQIDLALDTFPYSGGATICETIWMGVPVLTRPGDTFASRHATSFLNAAGLQEFICVSEEDLIARSAALANDRGKLTSLRASQRALIRRSPLIDHDRFCADLTGAIREVWRSWCAS